ncbi:hypothetical protein WJ973_18225 [Achromobacter xylosoxidans]
MITRPPPAVAIACGQRSSTDLRSATPVTSVMPVSNSRSPANGQTRPRSAWRERARPYRSVSAARGRLRDHAPSQYITGSHSASHASSAMARNTVLETPGSLK